MYCEKIYSGSLTANSPLAQLIATIETLLRDDPTVALTAKHKIQHALEAYTVDMRELTRFALFDAAHSYTRNLISTDHTNYALMLLCWNRGQYSPIHDHTATGCWIKAVQGEVHEIRYVRDRHGERFVETANTTYSSGVTYMDDSLGFHRVGNPRDDVDAITMHLYAPPYETCHVWHDAERASDVASATTTYYSMFGKREGSVTGCCAIL